MVLASVVLLCRFQLTLHVDCSISAFLLFSIQNNIMTEWPSLVCPDTEIPISWHAVVYSVFKKTPKPLKLKHCSNLNALTLG